MAQSENLSDREWDVVNLLLEGKSNKLIATSLKISESTVEFHLKNIYTKYQVSSRTELILKLGKSTVAASRLIGENKSSSNAGNWITSLGAAISRIYKELGMASASASTDRSGATNMTFFEAIIVCLKNYAEFKGRASRPEFWWFTLAITLVSAALAYIDQVAVSVFTVAVLLPFLAVGSRRLRDSGQSPWWLWFILVPVAGIFVVGYLCAAPTITSQPDDSLSA